VLNHFVNMVGYNPGGAQHGYLWWLAWLDHNARTLFSVQDANGDFRPLFLQASCATLAQVADSVGGAEALLNLTPILTNLNLCPTQATANARDYQLFQQGKLPANVARGAAGPGTLSANVPFLPKLPTN
jgi:hypothetical protein